MMFLQSNLSLLFSDVVNHSMLTYNNELLVTARDIYIHVRVWFMLFNLMYIVLHRYL